MWQFPACHLLICCCPGLLGAGQAMFPWDRKFGGSYLPACADWIQVSTTQPEIYYCFELPPVVQL
jgi:hypothetical protein